MTPWTIYLVAALGSLSVTATMAAATEPTERSIHQPHARSHIDMRHSIDRSLARQRRRSHQRRCSASSGSTQNHGSNGSNKGTDNGSSGSTQRNGSKGSIQHKGSKGSTLHKGSMGSTQATDNESSGDTSTATQAGNLAALTSLGITGFLSDNGPGIGSWFRTNSGQDSTNGHSWCGYPYNDNSNGFAPDVQVMLGNFGGDYNKAATAYCGLEAIVTTPGGVTKTMYIVDGFDHRWVREPGSIDITKNRFAELYGSATDDKNIVIKGITWKLTGNRSDQYKFKGAGN